MSASDQPVNLDDIDFGHTIRGHQKGDRVFDRFVLEKLLGRGGMGVVWLAKDERLGREVALKFAPEAVRFDDVAVDELKEETRRGLNLAHPNIVKIYDFLVDEDHAAISMEFIDGENLGALRTRQPNKIFEPAQISHWVGQMLEALDYAHRIAKVIHRDLKPANLMIDREGNLRVTDFGIARSISDAMNRATLGAGNSTGTLAYMSPQQSDGKKPHISDDLYAFGSTLYELLTGKPPFYSGNIVAQLHDEAVTSLTDRRREFGITAAEPIPPEWEQTILACLEKAAENRPSSAQAVRQRLGLAPATTQDVPPLPVVGGASGLGHASPQTSHVGTQTYVRAGSGLTEVDVPGRQIGLGNIRIGGSVTPMTTTVTAEPVKASGCSVSLVLTVVACSILVLGLLGGGGWWAYKNFKNVKVDPLVVSADPVPKPPVDPPPVTPPVKPPTPPVIPPKTSAIQAMINEAKPGSEVIVPEGIYEEQLRFREGITLRAAQPGKVIVQTDGRLGSALLVENCHGGTISGFVFQHTGDEVAEKVSWPVVMLKSSSIILDNCTVQSGVSDGLFVTGAGKPQIIRCLVQRNAKHGIVLESGTAALLQATESRKNGENGVDIRFTGTAPVLNQCIIADNELSGISVIDGATASVLDKTMVRMNKDVGIAATGSGSSLTVDDAVSEDNLVGIAVQSQGKATIRNSTVRGSKQAGIQITMAAEGTEVAENTIDGSKMEGVLATGAEGTSVSITKNNVRGSGGSGIGVFGKGFKPQVVQNECTNNTEYGILAIEGVSGVLRDNTVTGNHIGAIGSNGAASDIVIQGNITGN